MSDEEREEIRNKILRAANKGNNSVIVHSLTARNQAFFEAGGFKITPSVWGIVIAWNDK